MSQSPHPPSRDPLATSSREGIVTPPRPLTSFVGRDAEIAAIVQALNTPDTRLLTLTGTGGVGKTRLAIRAADGLRSLYPDGIAWVDLAPLTDPGQVGTTLLRSLAIPEQPSVPAPERLLGALKDDRLLIILDNFEHVVEAATIVSSIIDGTDRVDILITSREPLNLTAERTIAVTPFDTPATGSDADTLAHAPGVRLFVQRAQAARASFTPSGRDIAVAAEICGRVDGLPLAIELAAARIAHLSPAALLARMESRLPMLTGGKRDVPARQQTMRDTIAWSHQMLSPDEQVLFRRLAIFAGGCTLESAESVMTATGGSLNSVVDGIPALVDRNLLRQVESGDGDLRFTMFETIREFAREQLTASGDLQATGDAHAACFMELAGNAYANHRGASEPTWLARLETERANLVSALAWLDAHERHEELLRLATSLHRLWILRGPVSEGRWWFDRALSSSHDDDPGLRPTALVWAADLTNAAGDSGRAISMLDEAHDLALAADDQSALSLILGLRGVIAMEQGDDSLAETLFADSVTIARDQPADSLADVYINISIGILCQLALNRGDLAIAEALASEACAIAQRRNDHFAIAAHTIELGTIARERGDLGRATTCYRDALSTIAVIGDRHVDLPNLLAGVARLGALRGQPTTAAALLGATLALARSAGAVFPRSRRNDFEPALQLLVAELGKRRLEGDMAHGENLDPDQAIALASALLDGLPAREGLPTHRLTPREMDVLRLIAEGMTDREIAARLSLSPRTVQRHVSGILDTFDVHTRSAAVALAVRHGVLEPA